MTERRRRPRKRGIQLTKDQMILGGAIFIALVVFLIITLSIQITVTPVRSAEPLELVFGKDTYVEEGASASYDGKQLAVEISGSVDMNRLGTYKITYTARCLWVSKSVTREVRVVDKTAPVITLTTDLHYFPTSGEEYREEGYTATDDCDGDLTQYVLSRREGDVIYYTVKDRSGNETTVMRNILRKDLTPPVITLKGESYITIQAGTAFEEPGYTAVDDRDGDITNKVVVTGSVNIYCADTYVLTYTSTDSFGNVTQAERTVVVEPIKQPETVNPSGKVIYLTFDDGPSQYTQALLDVLAKYNAKATFFVVNTGYKMETLLNGMVEGGHSIGIHSMTHVYEEIYASEEAFFNDLLGMQALIKKYTGVTTTLMRFPGGTSNTVSRFNPGIMTRLTQAVTDMGFQYFDWHVDSNDANGKLLGNTNEEKSQQLASNVINGIGNKKQVIVLQHDIYSYSVDAVEQIIIWGLQNGYTFQALTENSPQCHHKVNN